jgi:hypothetical protein
VYKDGVKVLKNVGSGWGGMWDWFKAGQKLAKKRNSASVWKFLSLRDERKGQQE